MLNFFRKNREDKLGERDFRFLSAVDNSLKNYDFSSQINREFIIGKRSAMLSEKEGSFSYQFNGDLESVYFQPGP